MAWVMKFDREYPNETIGGCLCQSIRTIATRLLANGHSEAAPESKVENAKEIIIYALALMCFSQKLGGKIFDLLRFRVLHAFSM